MTDEAFQQDIQSVYALADQGMSLDALMDAIGGVLSLHQSALRDITHSYRLRSTDTGYQTAFSLTGGHYVRLDAAAVTDVTILGKEADLQRVFQRKLAPAAALLLGKIKLAGSKSALLKLAAFL